MQEGETLTQEPDVHACTHSRRIDEGKIIMMSMHMQEYVAQEGETIEPERLDALAQNIEPIFSFAIVWGIGGAADVASKRYSNEY